MELIFSGKALRNLKKLDKPVQKRIIEKLETNASEIEPLKNAEKLVNSIYGEYRFRVGNYRVIFDIQENTIVILKIGHRREIYK